MTKTETTYRQAAEKLAGLQGRRDELWVRAESAKSELSAFRKDSAEKLIGGGDSEKIASALASRESKSGMFSSTLVELDARIAQAQTVSDEAEQKWNAEQDAETIRKVRATTVKLIKTMGNLQVDLAKAAKEQGKCPRKFVDFNTAATTLEESQAVLEVDAKVRERSKVPSAARIPGFLDDKRTIASLGSKFRDWAREDAR